MENQIQEKMRFIVNRSAFDSKNSESNFINLNKAKDECKLKMFRKFGECSKIDNENQKNQCIINAINSKCSVSKTMVVLDGSFQRRSNI